MNIHELVKDDQSVRQYLLDFFKHPHFLKVKDAFVCHTPSGESESMSSGTEDPLVLAHGKLLGTRFVFNTIETISRTKPEDKKTPRERTKGSTDPDLES